MENNSRLCPFCQTEIKNGDPFCPSCGKPIGQLNNNTIGVSQENAPVSGYYSATQNTQTPANKTSTSKLLNLIFSIGGTASSVLSIIFGIIMFGKSTGSVEIPLTYGGDAYTGIQNAAAQTATNILLLNKIAKTGFGFLLIALGLIAGCYFASKLFKAINNK